MFYYVPYVWLRHLPVFMFLAIYFAINMFGTTWRVGLPAEQHLDESVKADSICLCFQTSPHLLLCGEFLVESGKDCK